MLTPITVRVAEKGDLPSLMKIPQYSGVGFPYEEDILVAERSEEILGAVSIGQRHIRCARGEWRNNHGDLTETTEMIAGPWISKLYVFFENRLRGIGTKLIEAAVEHRRKKGSNEIYTGIYIRNKCRSISLHIFEKCGFKEIGSCICPLPNGYCRGTLLKRDLLDESE